MAAQRPTVTSTVPEGYGENAHLNKPLSPTINVPEPKATRKVISHGTDKHGEPNVSIESVPAT